MRRGPLITVRFEMWELVEADLERHYAGCSVCKAYSSAEALPGAPECEYAADRRRLSTMIRHTLGVT